MSDIRVPACSSCSKHFFNLFLTIFFHFPTELRRQFQPREMQKFLHSLSSHRLRLSKPPTLRNHSRRDTGRTGHHFRAESGSGLRQETGRVGSTTGINFGAICFRLSRNFCDRGWVCSRINCQVSCHWRFRFAISCWVCCRINCQVSCYWRFKSAISWLSVLPHQLSGELPQTI